jgi:hypothetical protein
MHIVKQKEVTAFVDAVLDTAGMEKSAVVSYFLGIQEECLRKAAFVLFQSSVHLNTSCTITMYDNGSE